jgi:hypothetical protein
MVARSPGSRQLAYMLTGPKAAASPSGSKAGGSIAELPVPREVLFREAIFRRVNALRTAARVCAGARATEPGAATRAGPRGVAGGRPLVHEQDRDPGARSVAASPARTGATSGRPVQGASRAACRREGTCSGRKTTDLLPPGRAAENPEFRSFGRACRPDSLGKTGAIDYNSGGGGRAMATTKAAQRSMPAYLAF